MLSLGGTAYPWLSFPVLALAAGSVASFAIMGRVELRAAQPILPPELFRNRVFVTGASVIALSTMALFAAAVFLPLMFQRLMGASPSRAGLMVAPMMGGVITASFGGGWLVSRTGRYKIFPVVGLLSAASTYTALAWATRAATGVLPMETILVVMGLGIGLVMPNLTTAIQNSVERRQLGSATAAAAFFRSLGGALGVAVSGTVLANHLSGLPQGLQGSGAAIGKLAGLPHSQQALVAEAYRAGLAGAFATGAVIAGLGFLVVLFLPERPLRDTPAADAGAAR